MITERQKHLFDLYLPYWRKLTEQDLSDLLRILVAYYVLRLKGERI